MPAAQRIVRRGRDSHDRYRSKQGLAMVRGDELDDAFAADDFACTPSYDYEGDAVGNDDDAWLDEAAPAGGGPMLLSDFFQRRRDDAMWMHGEARRLRRHRRVERALRGERRAELIASLVAAAAEAATVDFPSSNADAAADAASLAANEQQAAAQRMSMRQLRRALRRAHDQREALLALSQREREIQAICDRQKKDAEEAAKRRLEAAAATRDVPPPVLLLPVDCWGVVASFTTITGVIGLSSTCSWLRVRLNTDTVWAAPWKRAVVVRRSYHRSSIVRCLDKESPTLDNCRYVSRSPLRSIRREFLWSWHLSFRFIVLSEALAVASSMPHYIELDAYHAGVADWSRKQQRAEYAAWREVFLHAQDPLVKQWARVRLNAAAGMTGVAHDLALEFPFEDVPPRIGAILRIPASPEGRANFVSELRHAALGSDAASEWDVCAQLGPPHGEPRDSHMTSFAELLPPEEMPLRPDSSSGDKTHTHETYTPRPRNSANPRRKESGRQRHVRHHRVIPASRSIARVMKQMRNIGPTMPPKWRGWGAVGAPQIPSYFGSASQELTWPKVRPPPSWRPQMFGGSGHPPV